MLVILDTQLNIHLMFKIANDLSGDLLQSNGDGTAKVQADDMIRASTFAKVLSNTVIDTYEDGSFIVPCSLMC